MQNAVCAVLHAQRGAEPGGSWDAAVPGPLHARTATADLRSPSRSGSAAAESALKRPGDGAGLRGEGDVCWSAAAASNLDGAGRSRGSCEPNRSAPGMGSGIKHLVEIDEGQPGLEGGDR